uniref:Helicase ATP-binding domain-containing protein n=1 Tax=Acrobeloides nanus TaxID=290746 RepID=A0A914BY62_9BILA
MPVDVSDELREILIDVCKPHILSNINSKVKIDSWKEIVHEILEQYNGPDKDKLTGDEPRRIMYDMRRYYDKYEEKSYYAKLIEIIQLWPAERKQNSKMIFQPVIQPRQDRLERSATQSSSNSHEHDTFPNLTDINTNELRKQLLNIFDSKTALNPALKKELTDDVNKLLQSSLKSLSKNLPSHSNLKRNHLGNNRMNPIKTNNSQNVIRILSDSDLDDDDTEEPSEIYVPRTIQNLGSSVPKRYQLIEVEEENATKNTSPEDLFERLETTEAREHTMEEDEPVEDDVSDIEELGRQTTPKKRKIIEEEDDEFESSTNPNVNEIEPQEEGMSDGQDENSEDDASDIEELGMQATPKKRAIIEEDDDKFESFTNPGVNEVDLQEENMSNEQDENSEDEDEMQENTSDAQDENNEDEDEIQEESMDGQEQNHEDAIVDEPTDKSLAKYCVLAKRGLLLDDDSSSDELNKDPVYLHSMFLDILKSQQIEGIKVLYKSTIGSLKNINAYNMTNKYNGVTLSHDPGLGKTLTVMAFLFTILTHKKLSKIFKRVLILAPASVILNTWKGQFKKWRKKIKIMRKINIVALTKREKNEKLLVNWDKFNKKKPTIMVLSYEIFRRWTYTEEDKDKAKNFDSPKKGGKITNLDIDKSQRLRKILQDPGPDLVICDEAHKLKNKNTLLYKTVIKIATKRRICLTGTPLQNHLKEYYDMIAFVRPDLLPEEDEFKRRFDIPIREGIFADALDIHVFEMKMRCHILHNKQTQRCI